MDRENNMPVNWVIRYGACHKDTILHALYEQVSCDVDDMKKLELRKGDCFSYEYEIKRTSDSIRVIKILNKMSRAFAGVMYPHFSIGDPVGVAHFIHNGANKISVSSTSQSGPDKSINFQFNFSWNSDEATCKYTIDGKPFRLWEISKRALEPLFFLD